MCRVHHELIQGHDVRVSDIREAAELPLEASDVGRARAQQGLERNRFVADDIVRGVDDAHAARTEPAKDPESLRASKLRRELTTPRRSRTAGRVRKPAARS